MRSKQTKNILNTDLAYAAGLIDGEGCIKIYKVQPDVLKNRKNPRYNLQLQIDMVDDNVLYWMQEKFGGKIYIHDRSKLKNCRNSLRWYMFQNDMRAFLPMILPYMKVRDKQTKVGINFLDCGHGDFANKEKFYKQLVDLNRRGLKAKQPSLRK